MTVRYIDAIDVRTGQVVMVDICKGIAIEHVVTHKNVWDERVDLTLSAVVGLQVLTLSLAPDAVIGIVVSAHPRDRSWNDERSI